MFTRTTQSLLHDCVLLTVTRISRVLNQVKGFECISGCCFHKFWLEIFLLWQLVKEPCERVKVGGNNKLNKQVSKLEFLLGYPTKFSWGGGTSQCARTNFSIRGWCCQDSEFSHGKDGQDTMGELWLPRGVSSVAKRCW